MRMILSKSFMSIIGLLLVLVKFAFFADMGVIVSANQFGAISSFTGYAISFTMLLSMVGVVAYVLSRGLLETES